MQEKKQEGEVSPKQMQYKALLDTASKTTKQAQLISVQGILIMATYMLVAFLREQKPQRRYVLSQPHSLGAPVPMASTRRP